MTVVPKMIRPAKAAAALALALACSALTGCANMGPGAGYPVIQAGQSGQILQSQRATVLAARPVSIQGSGTGGWAGTATGVALGGLAGNMIGHGKGSVAGAILGAALGGVAGSASESAMARRQGVELHLRMDTGQEVTIVQEVSAEMFAPGERVRVVHGYGPARVTH